MYVRYRPDTCTSPACHNDPELCPDRMICESIAPKWLSYIDIVCVIFFTIEYLIRILLAPLLPARLFIPFTMYHLTAGRLCSVFDPTEWDVLHPEDDYPDPEYSILSQFFYYALEPMNLVDFAAILPLYINVAISPSSVTDPSSSSSFVIIRLLRLIRIVRIFKIIRERQDFLVLTVALRKSLPVLSMLFYYTLLGTIVVGAVIFQFEQGEFRVTSEYPDGAYLRPSVLPGNGWEESPFTSIWAALYWSVITATTLGYGDLYPTTPLGRVTACIWIFCGIVIIAMPIGIIGSNFSAVYEEFKDREIERKKQNLLSQSSRRSIEQPPSPLRYFRQKLSTRRLIPKVSFKYFQQKQKICPQSSSSQSLPLPSPSSNAKEDVDRDHVSPPHEEDSADMNTSISIKRQTLRDLFDLIQQFNQIKSEETVIERKISEITLILKRQEAEEINSSSKKCETKGGA